MKTIQLSERELSMIFSMLTPPYAVSDNHTDEFNELRNKVFYALRDAQNDEPVSEAYKLPVIGWLRSDYNSDDKRDPNAPLFMLGSNDPTETWGVKYIPLAGNSPVIGVDLASGTDRTAEVRYFAPPGYVLVPIEPTTNQWAAGMQAFDSGMDKVTRVYKAMIAAAPQQEAE